MEREAALAVLFYREGERDDEEEEEEEEEESEDSLRNIMRAMENVDRYSIIQEKTIMI